MAATGPLLEVEKGGWQDAAPNSATTVPTASPTAATAAGTAAAASHVMVQKKVSPPIL